MAPQKDAGQAAVCGGTKAEPGPGATLDPLILALSRALDRLGPCQPPAPRPDTAG